MGEQQQQQQHQDEEDECRSRVLNELAQRRTKLMEELQQIESTIWELEGRYLQDSPAQGNVLKGFEGFAQQARAGSSSAQPSRRRTPLRAEERLFSLSSATSPVVRSFSKPSSISLHCSQRLLMTVMCVVHILQNEQARREHEESQTGGNHQE